MLSSGKQQATSTQTNAARKLTQADMKVVRRIGQQEEPLKKIAQNKQNAQNFQNN